MLYQPMVNIVKFAVIGGSGNILAMVTYCQTFYFRVICHYAGPLSNWQLELDLALSKPEQGLHGQNHNLR